MNSCVETSIWFASDAALTFEIGLTARGVCFYCDFEVDLACDGARFNDFASYGGVLPMIVRSTSS